jgi:hypothetical protein
MKGIHVYVWYWYNSLMDKDNGQYGYLVQLP